MQVEGITISDYWCELLAKLQQTDPNAIIAGGFLRDLYYSKEIADVDFFTTAAPDWPNAIGGLIDYEGMKYVNYVMSFSNYSLPVNVIGVEEGPTHMQLLETFDFGFCQIGFDGKDLIKTPAFDWDFKHGVITMRHTDRYARSIRRYSRWLPRYAMNIVIPQLETKVAF